MTRKRNEEHGPSPPTPLPQKRGEGSQDESARSRSQGGKGRADSRQRERVEFARQQRRHANDFARGVWEMVRGRRMLGEKFRREHPVGPYTLDFVCLDLKLNIEVDGKDHSTEDGMQHDEQRDAYLRELGFEVLRIAGFQVTKDFISVRDEIEQVLKRLRAKRPSPPKRGEGEGE